MKKERFYILLLCATVILAGFISCEKETGDDENKDGGRGGNASGISYTIGECELEENTATIHFEIVNKGSTDEELALKNVSTDDSWIYDDWGNRYDNKEKVYIKIGDVESNDYTISTVLSRKKKLKGTIKIREISTKASALNFNIHTNQGFDLKKINLKLPNRTSSLPENKLNLVKKIAGFDFAVLTYEINGTNCTIHYKVTNTNATMKKLSFSGMALERSWLFDDWGYNYKDKTSISLGNNMEKYSVQEFIPSNITLYGRLIIRELSVKASSLNFNLTTNLNDDFRFDNIKLVERVSSLPISKAQYTEVSVPSELECKIIKCCRNGTTVTIDYSLKNKDANSKKISLNKYSFSITNQLGEKYSNYYNVDIYLGGLNKTSELIPYNITVYGKITLTGVKENTSSLNLNIATNYPLQWSIKDLAIE